MQFSVKTGTPESQRTACAILPVFEDSLTGSTAAFDALGNGVVRRLLRQGDISARLGRTLLITSVPEGPAQRWLLVGAGEAAKFDAKRLAKTVAAAAAALADTDIHDVVSFLGCPTSGGVDAYYAARTTVEALRSATYRFDEFKSGKPSALKLARVGLWIDDKAHSVASKRGITHGTAIANGVDLARNLGNRPPNVCTPSHIADTARELGKQHPKLTVKVLTERNMEQLGMGALLAVARGASAPPRFVIVEYRGTKASSRPIVLCGKGITFDTGGISLKPPPKMDEMKFDMCGAAGVLGAMSSIAELGLPLNAVALLACAENMPGGNATRPGDIVTSLSGKTIEILNTDAEGRLALCDALAYAKRFKPRCIIDVATLTGACVVALGSWYTGLFSNDDGFADALLKAGSRSLDGAWRLPADDEYGETLASNFADFANIGEREGGASLAAQFLSRFVEDTPWAHLDIAGVAWHSGKRKGATGRPVPLLVDYLLNLEE